MPLWVELVPPAEYWEKRLAGVEWLAGFEGKQLGAVQLAVAEQRALEPHLQFHLRQTNTSKY